MSQTITAIYAEGMLRPLSPLDLPEQTRVELEVRQTTLPEKADLNERDRVFRALFAAGAIINRPFDPPPAGMLSDEERAQLAERLAVGQPLSEIIIEEREGR